MSSTSSFSADLGPAGKPVLTGLDEPGRGTPLDVVPFNLFADPVALSLVGGARVDGPFNLLLKPPFGDTSLEVDLTPFILFAPNLLLILLIFELDPGLPALPPNLLEGADAFYFSSSTT